MSRSPQPPRANFLHRTSRWLLPAALLTLAPKCFLCVAAYFGFAAALGFSGREICGPLADGPSLQNVRLLCIGLSVLTATGFVAWTHRRKKNPKRGKATELTTSANTRYPEK